MDNAKMNLNASNEFNWDSNTWNVIDAFFKQDNVLVDHQISSFNYFMSNQLQNIVKEKDLNQVKIFNKDSWNEELQQYTETYIVEFGKIYVSKPVLYDAPNKPMYPAEARLRKLTYAGNLYIDIHHKTVTFDPKTGQESIQQYTSYEKYPCGKMPIMVGSKYCVLTDQNNITKNEMGEGEFDMGGYFIIKGSEKVVITREKKCDNKVYCFKHKLGQSKYSDVAEISCVHPENPSVAVPVWVKMKAKEETFGGNVLRVRLRRMKQDIPLVIIFRALNVISDKSIMEMVVYNTEKESAQPLMELLKASIEEARPIVSQKLALEYISKYINGIQSTKYKTTKCKLKYTFEVLCEELFPHIGISPIKKAYYLGYMVNRLFKTYLGLLEYDDRDSFLNKRVETAGELMSQIFRTYFGQFVKDLKTTCDKDMLAGRFNEIPDNLGKKLKPNNIEIGIKLAFSTGNWGLKNQAKTKTAVTAVLQRMTYLGTLSNLRRIVAPLDKNMKQTDPRKLHSTHWGMICPYETPEGASIGIVKNMSMMCHITIDCNSDIVIACLDEFGVKSLEGVQPFEVFDSVKVFVNGDWYGQSFEPNELVNKLRAARRVGILNPYISISWYINTNEIYIWTDGGRLCRPLYIVRENKLNITNELISNFGHNLKWKDLIIKPINIQEGFDLSNIDDSKAIIEFVDIMESDNIMVAMNQDNLMVNTKKNFSYLNYTHCEIHPSMILGVLASNIPFPEHNQGPRNLFQGAMGKQAMGVYSTGYKNRMDTMAHVLHYPQKPMVNTEPSKYLNSDSIPSGQMAIVAVACYTGYNQQDSLIFNQSAIDRGLFGSSFFRTYVDEEKKNSTTLEDEKFCKPQKYYPNGKTYTEKMSFGSYDKLDDNGFVKLNSFVEGNDIIIGKVTMIKDAIDGEPKQRDLSTPLRNNESGIVDKVYKNSNGEGYNFVKVRVRSDRRPEVGDKFASRHGQKGTIGMTYRQEDMPFTKGGVIPDLIMNPHALPKRMTIAQLIECVFGKAGSLIGCEFDATPFRKVTVENITEVMEKLGYNGAGTEVLYNGKTGEQIVANIFIGPTFYYRLKHLVEDKLHCLDYETEILTKNGWKYGKDLEKEDEVATLINNELVYEKPKEIYKYPEHQGDMYYIKNQSIDMAVTSEHRMWTSKVTTRQKLWTEYNFEYAKDIIGKHRRYKKDANWKVDDYQFLLPSCSIEFKTGEIINYPEKIVNMNSWLIFFGIWYAEGWATGDDKTGNVVLSVNKQRVKDALFLALDNLEIKYRHSKSDEKCYLSQSDHQLYMYMKKLSVGAVNKKLPDWVFELSIEQTRVLINSMQLGDGCFSKNGTSVYYTASKDLANQFQQLALHAGWASIVSIHIDKESNHTQINGRDIVNHNDIYRCSLIKSKLNPSVNHGHSKKQEVQDERYEINVKCPVWCVNVSSEVFYVRRNGKACWTGNSRSTGPYQLLSKQPAEGRSRDGGFRFGEMERDAILSHGTMQFLKERTFDCSDKYFIWVDNETGMISPVNPEKNIYKSMYSDNTTNFSKVQIPYSSKLLFQELMSMHIVPRIFTEKSPNA